MLGLDRGGSCRGIAFGQAPHVEATIDLLWDREMVSGVYAPKIIKVSTDEAASPPAPSSPTVPIGNVAVVGPRMSSASSGRG